MKEQKYKYIFNYFGYDAQRRKLNEEVQELNDAILLYELGIGTIQNVIEEIADIKNVISGFIEDYDITEEEINFICDEKRERTLERIKDGYYKK